MPRITSLRAEIMEIPLRHHFATARDVLARQVSRPVVVTLEADDGVCATGEAVPVAYVTGETPETALEAILSVEPLLLGADLLNLDLVLRALNARLPDSPSARAGVEMALFTAHAAARGISLWDLWGRAISGVETDITLSIGADTVERAREAATRGFRHFKLKVGSEDREEDFRRLRAVHEAVPGGIVRVDANQAFTAPEAIRFAGRALEAGIPLELIEQPVPREDLAALDAVAAASPVPVFADEAVRSPQEALRVVRETRAHGLNVKLMKSGIVGALEIIRIAREHDRQLMIGCMLETRRGIAASLALACGTGAFDYVDLDSHLLLREEGENTWFDEDGPWLTIKN